MSKKRQSIKITLYKSTITLSVRGITVKGYFTLTILHRLLLVFWTFLVLNQMPLVFDVTDMTEEGNSHIHNTHFMSY